MGKFLFSAVLESSNLKFPYEEVKKEVKAALANLEAHRKEFYPYLDAETAKNYGAFLLWHYAVSFFGNVPTGVLTVHLKDPVLKVILSLYERRVYPVYYWVDEKTKNVNLYETDFNAYLYLRLIYETEQLKGFFSRLDRFNPLPFKI